MNYPIADLLIRIKNAQMIRAERVLVPSSKIKLTIVNILKDAGYVSDVSKKKKKAKKSEHEWLDIGLNYANHQEGAISGVKIVSKPSRHLYLKVEDIKPVRSGFGIAVISTSKGIMTGTQARKAKLGGELLFEIW